MLLCLIIKSFVSKRVLSIEFNALLNSLVKRSNGTSSDTGRIATVHKFETIVGASIGLPNFKFESM